MKNIQENSRQVYSGIGGQAVIEGIMMKNGQKYSVGIRKADSSIDVAEFDYVSLSDRYSCFRWPLLRGIVSFIDSMVLGMRTLSYSASFFEDDEGSEPGKFEQFLERVFGDKLEKLVMGFALVLSFAVAIIVFMLLPVWLSNLIKPWVGPAWLAFLEGVLRVLIFILYIKLVSRTEDIRRTFQYHGAEHKCINCIEHGLPLTVDCVKASSKEHKRCGTSFLVYVMLISILLFMLVPAQGLMMKFISRIVLVPLIAGISYELLRLAGRSESRLTALLSRPGMWMQGLTTLEPDERQIEVAIAAVEKVFDWRGFQAEHFSAEQQTA